MPTIPNIRTAVENQNSLVLDEHAKAGTFLRDSRGRLIAYSGGFTVVFPYTVKTEKWAFRCWHSELGNVRRRFESIAKAIQKSRASYLCDFAYTDEGVIVDGKIYPTTRMRWVDGLPIKDYVCKYKNNKQKLENLANKFLLLVHDMHQNGFAHGDLQHGNIIVDSRGELFLVDYDSFYCAELKGEPDIITGLRDYQHPLRQTNKIVSEKLDYFSELIIYLSILGIAENPTLVEKYQVEGAEHMLFEADDFKHIHSSKIFQELHGLSYEIDTLLTVLDIYLHKQSLDELEPFEIITDRLTKDPVIHSFISSCGDVCLQGDSVRFSWNVENYNQVLFNGEDVTSKSALSCVIRSSNIYSLEVVNGKKRVSKFFAVTAIAPPSISFTSDKTKIHKGKTEPVRLDWNVQNVDSVSLLDNNKVIIENCNQKDVYNCNVSQTTCFTIQVVALDHKTTLTKSITIEELLDATLSLKTDKEYVFPSIPFTISWNSQNAKDVELNGKKVQTSGSELIQNGVNIDTVYTLRVRDDFGIKEESLTIKVLPLPRIESLIVPVPDLEKSIEVKVDLGVPNINVSMPQIDIAGVNIIPPEMYDVNVETWKVPSPPKVDLMVKEIPKLSRLSWENLLEMAERTLKESKRKIKIIKSKNTKKNGK